MEPFDHKRYSRLLEENKLRMSAAENFEEADRVPVLIGLGGPYYAWLFGRTFADYYNNFEIMLDTQVKGLKWRLEWLKDDVTGIGVWYDAGSTAEGVVFDCEIRMPCEASPWMSPWIVPRVRTLDDIDKLEVPDPRSHTGIKAYYERVERFKGLAKENYGSIPVSGGLQIHPPVSAAGSLLGPSRLYSWLYRYPSEMHRLLRKLKETFDVLKEHNDEVTDTEEGSLHLADDHAGYLNRNLYEKFVLPYNSELYEAHGTRYRTLHMDSHMDHITDLIRDIYKVRSADVGVENDIRLISEAFKGRVVFKGNADWRALVGGSFEAIEMEVEKCVFHSAPGGGYIFDNGGETYVGLSPERLKYEVDYVKRVGEYPIRVDRFKHMRSEGGGL